MNFKALVESVIDEHGDIYTIEELFTMSKWEVSAIRIKDIQRMLRQKGYYKMGIRGLVPDVELRNEIELKAKELFASTPKFEYWRVHSELTKWVETSLPKERYTEIYREHGEKSMGAPIKVALKVLTYSLIIFPEKFASSTRGRDYDREKEIKEELHKDLKSMFIGSHFALDFRKEVEEWGITQFKVYKEYNLDKETEQAWGSVLNEL